MDPDQSPRRLTPLMAFESLSQTPESGKGSQESWPKTDSSGNSQESWPRTDSGSLLWLTDISEGESSNSQEKILESENEVRERRDAETQTSPLETITSKINTEKVQNWRDKQEKTIPKTLLLGKLHLHEEREKNFHILDKFQEKCKKMAYDNIEHIKRREEKKVQKELAKLELAQELLDKREEEKKIKMQKYLTEPWDGQAEYKLHKKKKCDNIIKQGANSLLIPERLRRTEDIEKKKEKKEKKQKLSTQDKTEPNMEDQKKTVDDNLEDILRKEAAYDSLLQKKLCNSMAKEEVAKMLHEAHQQEKKTQKPQADEMAARYQNKQKQKMERDRTERQGVLPGYRAEDIEARRQKDPQQKLKTQDETKKHMDNTVIIKWKMLHSVTEQRRDVQKESGFANTETDCNIPDKDRSREIRKKIVYDQLSVIKNEEAKKKAVMEDKLLKERKQRESAEQKREKLEKEKKDAAMKSLTNSWDSQIQHKRQEKKKICEIQMKDMHSLMQLDRVCGGENTKMSHPTLPARSSSKNCARRSVPLTDKHAVCSAEIHDDTKPRPLLSRQKIDSAKKVTLPSLKSNTVHFAENCQHPRKTVRFPSISPLE